MSLKSLGETGCCFQLYRLETVGGSLLRALPLSLNWQNRMANSDHALTKVMSFLVSTSANISNTSTCPECSTGTSRACVKWDVHDSFSGNLLLVDCNVSRIYKRSVQSTDT